MNGGNAAVPCEDPNLASGGGGAGSGGDTSATAVPKAETQDSSGKATAGAGNTDAQEVNGEVRGNTRKHATPPSRRRMKKFKANSTSAAEGDATPVTTAPGTRGGRKRKLSEYEDASSEGSEEFNGFDAQGLELQPGSNVLKKLIAEAEIAEAQLAKRIKYSSRIFDTKEKVDDSQEFDSTKTYVFETDSFGHLETSKIKKEKESDRSETDSIDIPNSIDSEVEPSKVEITSIRSANSSSAASSPSATSQRSKGSLVSGGGASPGGKQKAPIDMLNPLYREPFKYGWKRELVFRASHDSSLKKMADIYYYTPKGKKVRSFREVAESLNSKELTIDNFTFFKEPLGLNDPEKEIIRDAKRARGSLGPGKKYSKKVSAAVKKAIQESAARKPVQEPATRKSLPHEPSTSRKQPVQDPPASTPAPETSKHVAAPVPTPTKAAKSAKTPPAYKTKTTAKKTPQIKIKSSEESEMLPPQRSTANTRRNQQAVEKTIPVKTKRLITRKQNQQELEQQQNFMNSVCAGYHALLRIFQYLKVQELLRAARVCKMWRDLAAHPSLWKTVRMKNSQVTDWDGLADTLQRRGTQHLDLRKMLVAGESDNIWRKFLTVIPRVTSLVKLELCRCPVMVVEDVIKTCPQLEVFSAMSIKCDSLTLESIGNLSRCQELRLKAITGMSLQQDLTPLQELTQLTQLSLTSVKELGKKKIEVVQALTNLETLELGECSDFPDKFGTTVLINLKKLERLRLEKGQGSCCTFDILEGVSQLENLSQMELVNFDVKNGFDKCLANCKNIKRLLIIPTYISQSATSNNMVLGGVTELSDNLTHFIWGVTLELLRVTELFVDQCNLMNKQVTGDSIPVLKPVPCLRLIADVEDENENQKDDKQQPHLTSPQVDILPLPQLQKLLLTALPKTRVKILKIPFHATWRQSISDTTTQ